MENGNGSRMVRALRVTGFGSAMRSATCPLEHECVFFRDEQGDQWKYFNRKAMYAPEFNGNITVSAIWNDGTLARVKVL